MSLSRPEICDILSDGFIQRVPLICAIREDSSFHLSFSLLPIIFFCIFFFFFIRYVSNEFNENHQFAIEANETRWASAYLVRVLDVLSNSQTLDLIELEFLVFEIRYQ